MQDAQHSRLKQAAPLCWVQKLAQQTAPHNA
jgi:hypothetical protein